MRLTKLASALTLLGLVAATSGLLGGCVDNRSTFYIDHLHLFSGDDSECVIDVSLDGDQRGTGTYDQFGGSPYIAYMVLGNQLAPLGNNDTLRPETSRIQIQGAVIEVTPPAGGTTVPSYTVPVAGTVHPDDSEDPGLGLITIPLLGAAPALNPGNYLVNITVFGETLGGTDVESGLFTFPISVTTYGAYSSCDSYDGLLDSGRIHPCGALTQDGYSVPCGASTDGVCARCQ